MSVDAVVLGGGDGGVIDPSCRFKGLLPIGGRPMIEWVVDAMRAAELVHEVAVVVPTAEDLGPWVDKVDKLVVSRGGFMTNVAAGVDSFRSDRPILISTGDIPTVIAADVDSFVRASIATGADFTYPLISKEDVLAAYPGSERTYVRLATGAVTGGNMALVNPLLVRTNREIGQRLFDTRKNAIQMARILGLGFVVRLAAGRLVPAEVEAKMGQLLGGTAAAVFTDRAAIGADVDKPGDVVVAERVLYELAAGEEA
ncbi:MAG: nucleotidyltransferase family protein [Coriobacteriia bacterium]|nr:nucleotidyltransferase family protein [Coriobacteriia bacterium]